MNPASSRSKYLAAICLIAGTLFSTSLMAQSDKRLQQAEDHFARGEYMTAASLFGQYLAPAKEQKQMAGFPLNSKKSMRVRKTDEYAVRYRQAESYRMANAWQLALPLYQQCFEKDPNQYASALLWTAVCERSLGDLVSAGMHLDKFMLDFPDHSLKQQAEKEKIILQFAKNQLSRPDSILFQVKKKEGAEAGFYAPSVYSGTDFLLTGVITDSSAGANMNPYYNRIFLSAYEGNSFKELKQLEIRGLNKTHHVASASVTPGAGFVYFTDWYLENGRVVSSIYHAAKNENGYDSAILLSSVNIPGSNSKQPFVTNDGKYLYFSSDRPGGNGGFDIWYAPLKADGTTGEAIHAGNVINSSFNEQAPFYHQSGKLIFSSDRLPGMGGYDLFVAEGKEQSWKLPLNMGHPVNSTRDDAYFFSAQTGAVLQNALVTSDRSSDCCLEIFSINKEAKKQVITGSIIDCNNRQPVENSLVTIKDASGQTLQMLTDNSGRYFFNYSGNVFQYQFAGSKDGYNEKVRGVISEGTSERGWLHDTLFNAAICLDKKTTIKMEDVVSVYFDFDKSDLKPLAKQQLDSIYVMVAADSTVRLQISGFTDGKGSAEYNKALSDKRAKVCADYLINKGMDAARITFESFGDCCPVEMEKINGRDNPDGRGLNRRALINVSR